MYRYTFGTFAEISRTRAYSYFVADLFRDDYRARIDDSSCASPAKSDVTHSPRRRDDFPDVKSAEGRLKTQGRSIVRGRECRASRFSRVLAGLSPRELRNPMQSRSSSVLSFLPWKKKERVRNWNRLCRNCAPSRISIPPRRPNANTSSPSARARFVKRKERRETMKVPNARCAERVSPLARRIRPFPSSNPE